MNCPVCKKVRLSDKELETHLKANQCSGCGGRWVASWQYWKWKEQYGGHLPNRPVAGADDLSVEDSTAAKLCPECRHFLRRYPVGEDLDFSLDRCGNCGGTWFDKNEWEVLKSRGLHENVHQVFSEIWQHRLRNADHQTRMDNMYKEKFGPGDYEKIKEIKEWITGHACEAELKAFLNL